MKNRLKILVVLLGIVSGVHCSSRAEITGQWEFDQGDLSAAIGEELWHYMLEDGTEFGSTSDFGLPGINGQPAQIMHFSQPDPTAPWDYGYMLFVNSGPNGGGVYINQYTLIMDILYPNSTTGSWRAVFQTNEANANDGDFFVNLTNGVGISGIYHGNLTPDNWHRLAVAVDLTLPNGGLMRKFIDGVKVGEQNLTGLDGRFSLYSTNDSTDWMLLFADDSGDNNEGYVNSIQFRNEALTDAQLIALGGPSAAGIPTGPIIITGDPPNRPVITAPAGFTFFQDTAVALTGSPFSDPDAGDTHMQSTWILAADAALTTILAEVSSTTALTSIALPPAGTVPGETMYASVVYQDAQGLRSPPAVPAPISVLAPPVLFQEDFEAAPDYGLPAGWIEQHNTTVQTPGQDPTDYLSDTYAGWLVVPLEAMQTVFAADPFNGQPYNPIVVKGKSLFALSAWREGYQIQSVETPDVDLGTGRQGVAIIFRSNFTPNQDSMAAIEYSTDSGAAWHPALIMIDEADVVAGDPVATMTTPYDDVPDPGGNFPGTYGAHLRAPVAEMGPFLSGRVNDDQSESDRVEAIRLAGLDGQTRVRFRFVSVGTNSWWWGVDDFGLHGTEAITTPPEITSISRSGDSVVITWTGGGTADQVQTATELSGGSWTDIGPPTDQKTAVIPAGSGHMFIRVVSP